MEVDPAGISFLDQAKSTVSQKQLTSDFSTFLKLLVTQLQNQDPLDPMDSSEFTSQLVQFSAVEQAIATNKNLEKLISLSNADQLNGAVAFLGHEVRARGTTSVLKDAEATWEYQNDLLMESSSILISDEDGKIVYVTKGVLGVGTHEFVWDGKDNAGKQLPDGNYSISVSAIGTNEEAISPFTFVTGRVTGVQTADGETTLNVNGGLIPLNDVLSILEGDPQESTL